MLRVPASANAITRPDYTDARTLADQLMQTAEELAAMTDDVAKARVVREYDGERRKRALADRVREFLVAGDSASAAETKGRASAGYGEALDSLQRDLTLAEGILARHDAKRILWESLRSQTSLQKAIAANI